MHHKYLFFIQQEKIKTYQFRDHQFELVPYKGDDYYTFSEDMPFWQWWKKTASFFEETDTVDFCFLHDPEDYAFTEEFPVSEINSWTIEEVENFLNQHSKYTVLRDKTWKKKLVSAASMDEGLSNNVYATFYPEQLTESQLPEEKENLEERTEQGILASYYKEKTKMYSK
ncbi:hypothetical protein [Neobacillus dielmonensis]|uniref:hypothetical protein n=1 Tax=Neobacillus dielmonensis TaxID=1347369 RepID=UPI0005AAEAA6|nr:hypothetical protein [Neobacillus dielmonensis]